MAGFSGMQIPGTLGITTSGQIGPALSTGGSYAVRVFDLALATTVGLINLYSGVTSLAANLIMGVNGTNNVIHTDVGYVFANGCYAQALGGGSGSVNFVVEVK